MMEDFEKNMKTYFQEREIQPSNEAWNKMEALLKTKKATKKKYLYALSVAASLLLLVAFWQFFKQQQPLLIDQVEKDVFVVNDSILLNKKPTEVKYQQKAKQAIKHKKDREIVSAMIVNQPMLVKDQTEKENLMINDNPVEIKKNITQDSYEGGIAVASEPMKITVSAQRLLQRAEIERQVENTITEGQHFWKKVGDKHSLVHNNKKEKE